MNAISDKLSSNANFQESINILFNHKPKKKVIDKMLEELSELTTILLKYKNKKDEVSDEDILEELVDVNMHLQLVEKYFLYRDMMAMTNKKCEKMKQSKDFLKYKDKKKTA